MKVTLRTKITCGFLLVLAAGLLAWQHGKARPPRYQGDDLIVWLHRYSDTHGSVWFPTDTGLTLVFTNRHGESGRRAEVAIRHMGQAVIPYCVELISVDESKLESRLRSFVADDWLGPFRRRDLGQLRWCGICGLIALGPAAKSAVPDLCRLALTTNSMRVRIQAYVALKFMGPEADDSVPTLITCLRDRESWVQFASALSLGGIHQRPEQSIPALFEFLERTGSLYSERRCRVVEAIGEFRAAGKSAIPRLVALTRDADPNMRDKATEALRKIDPTVAANLVTTNAASGNNGAK